MLSLARGSFWYKCPFVPLIVKNFSPHPPSPSSHTHFTSLTRTHTIPSYHEQVSYERRNHLRLFRLGLTRVLSFDFVVWMGHLNTIPNCHSGTYSIWGLTISLKIKNFRVEILEKNPSPWDDSNTFWRRPRAKNPTFILVREKKSALLACLWLSSISKTHVAIVPTYFSKSMQPSSTLCFSTSVLLASFLKPVTHVTSYSSRQFLCARWAVPQWLGSLIFFTSPILLRIVFDIQVDNAVLLGGGGCCCCL